MLLLFAFSQSVFAEESFQLRVEPTVLVRDVRRFGVNLGTWTSWGAEQLMANVLKNPGFEGVEDRTLVIVKSADERRFTDDAEWLARPDGFWAGARFDVRTGPSAGQVGRLLDSRRAGRNGLPEFFPEGETPPLEPGNVVALSRQFDALPPTHWWIPPTARGQVATLAGQTRPGSLGRRSLALTAASQHPAEVFSYLDSMSDRAGKLLLVSGAWRVRFWCRLESGEATVTVEFGRQGAQPFVSQDVTPTQEWRQYELAFDAADVGPPGTLFLHLRTSTAPGRVLVDDVELGPVVQQEAQGLASAFRPEVIAALRRLRPGYLRDWQGQLGDTLENRLAEPSARRASRYRPEGLENADYGYSLPEFLDLCRLIGAQPWIIAPTTFGDEEFVGLGRYLAQRQATDHFDEILVEFGNENWNAIFRPGGIAKPQAHGEAAERAFRKIRAGAGTNVPLRMVVNGQHANPPYALDFVNETPTAEVLAVAPYVFPTMQSGKSLSESLALLFEDDGGRLQAIAAGARKIGKDFAVAEVNLHTVNGSAPADERDRVTAGAAAGSALAKTLLDSLALGARRQCVYVLAGYEAKLSAAPGATKLWGIVRDVGATQRFRPTGLALEMLNTVAAGDLHAVREVEGRPLRDLTVSVFHAPTGWGAAVVSAAAYPRTVTIHFPSAGAGELPQRLLRLDAAGPDSTNETSEEVHVLAEPVTQQGSAISIRLPAWGLVVLPPPQESH
jgi:hypothetical protein